MIFNGHFEINACIHFRQIIFVKQKIFRGNKRITYRCFHEIFALKKMKGIAQCEI